MQDHMWGGESAPEGTVPEEIYEQNTDLELDLEEEEEDCDAE